MNKINSVIIDDEYFNRSLVKMLVSKINPNFVILGEAENVSEGFNLINKLKPDVVFLDIKMPDGSGFDLLKKFSRMDFEVVFITGFDEYALQAFEYSALDYVLKPIDHDKFKLTLEKLQKRYEKNIPTLENLRAAVEAFDTSEMFITKIPIHFHDKVILIPVLEISHVESNQGCTNFYKENKEKYVSSKQLSDFEFILNHFSNFLRINKSTYVNLNYVLSYSKGSECIITMKDNSTMAISRRKKTKVLEVLSNSIKSVTN